MATIALVAIVGATTTAGTTAAIVGGIVASVAGAYLDQAFIYPALFGNKGNPDGPRLHDLSLQTASEGDPIKYIMGPANRVAGTLIFSTGLKESSKKEGGNKHSSGTRVYSYTIDCAVALGECPPGGIYGVSRIWANSKLIYSAGKVVKRYVESLTVYSGAETQTADPIMQASFGAAQTPAYRGTAYVMFKNLRLGAFGNVMPQIQFEVSAQGGLTVQDALGLILRRAGLTPSQYDVTLTSGYIAGYVVGGPQSTIHLLEPILAAYDIATQESNGILKFVTRGNEVSIPVDANDLSSREYSATSTMLPTRPLLLIDQPDHVIPSEVNIQFFDPANDYQQAVARQVLVNTPYTSVNQISIPMTLSVSTAAQIAATRLVRSHIERRTAKFDLPPSYFAIEENDLALVPFNGVTYTVRVEQVDRGNNYLTTITGVLTKTSGHSRGYDCSYTIPKVFYDPLSVGPIAFTFDSPAISFTNVSTPGLYFSITSVGSVSWAGGEIFESPDGVSDWVQLVSVAAGGVMGITITSLPAGVSGYWDNVSTVSVQLFNGTLLSDTDINVYNGANRMYVGGELIAFGVATLTAVGVYTLSHLLRGLGDSELLISSHTAGENIALISTDTTSFIPVGLGDIGSLRFFQAVPSGGTPGDYPTYPITFAGNTLRQYAPVCIKGRRDGTNNLTISWTRRTRSPNFPILTSTLTPPLLAVAESYRINITDGATPPVILRTLTSTVPTVAYSAASQTADGLTPGSPVNIIIYQLDDQNLLGTPGGALV